MATHRMEIYAKRLRQNITYQEDALLEPLTELGFEFQYILGRQIADFYHPEKKIVVELDGLFHYSPKTKNLRLRDVRRDQRLLELGVKRVVHIANSEVDDFPNVIIEDIKAILADSEACEWRNQPLPDPVPLFKGKPRPKRRRRTYWPYKRRTFGQKEP